MCVLVGVDAGLSVEERPAEEELEGALVHLKAQQFVLLHWGGPQGVPRQHSSGWKLLCGGEQLKMIMFQQINIYSNILFGSLSRKYLHSQLLFFVTLKLHHSLSQWFPN